MIIGFEKRMELCGYFQMKIAHSRFKTGVDPRRVASAFADFVQLYGHMPKKSEVNKRDFGVTFSALEHVGISMYDIERVIFAGSVSDNLNKKIILSQETKDRLLSYFTQRIRENTKSFAIVSPERICYKIVEFIEKNGCLPTTKRMKFDTIGFSPATFYKYGFNLTEISELINLDNAKKTLSEEEICAIEDKKDRVLAYLKLCIGDKKCNFSADYIADGILDFMKKNKRFPRDRDINKSSVGFSSSAIHYHGISLVRIAELFEI